MDRNRRIAVALSTAAIGLAILFGAARTARGQFFGPTPTFELSDAVHVDQADSAARTHLEQVKNYLAEERWDEAIETLRQVMENQGDKLVSLTPDRYVSVRDYCHLQIAGLPPEGLTLYRQRVDPQAEQWYREGLARADRQRLLDVVEELLCSSWADEALDALAELALDEGDYAGARTYWERTLSGGPPVGGAPRRLACPDSNLPLPGVRARLVYTSILEGSLARAESELQAFETLHPSARGTWGGRDVEYASALRGLLAAAARETSPSVPSTWQTFAGNNERNLRLSGMVDMGSLAWQQPLDPVLTSDAAVLRNLGFRPRRVGEENDVFLSYHPVLVDDLVLVAGPRGVSAFELRTGKPAWGSGQVFRETELAAPRGTTMRSGIGVPRYTLSVQGRRLFARLGTPVTSQATEFPHPQPPGYLVCLDLDAQGALVWKQLPPGEGWAFEGTPLCDGEQVYVMLRRTDVRPQSHVACLDAATGETRWSRLIAAAETPARGQDDEITHHLLSLHRDTLFVNTNLGAVAAVSTRDGAIRWLTRYRRAQSGDLSRPAAHLYRDLNPCVYYQGTVLVAPSDTPAILALDAATGQLLWGTQHAEDAVHLLGVGGGNLLASGDRLWWIDVETGRVVARWPDGPSPRGYGRGVLVGDRVYWPTREELYVFDQRTARQERVLSLAARFPGTAGGNLLVTDGYLLVATANRTEGQQLLAFSQFSGRRPPPEESLTQSPLPAVDGEPRTSDEPSPPRADSTIKWVTRAVGWQVPAHRQTVQQAAATPADRAPASPLPAANDARAAHLLARGELPVTAGQWFAPAGDANTTQSGFVRVVERQLSYLPCPGDGPTSPGWQCELNGSFRQAHAVGPHLIVLTDQAVQAHRVADGQLAWRQSAAALMPSDGGPAPALESLHRLSTHLVLESAAGRFAALAIDSGQPRWQFTVDRERLHRVVAVGDQMALELVAPHELVMVHGVDGAEGTHWPLAGEHWVEAPQVLEEQLVARADDGTWEWLDLRGGDGAVGPRWRRRLEPVAPPADIAWRAGGSGVVWCQADRGIGCWDAAEGRDRWTSDRTPADDVSRALRWTLAGADEAFVFAQRGGRLLAVRWSDGTSAWERHVARGRGAWRVERQGAWRVAFPVEAPWGQALEMLVLEPTRGTLVQRFTFGTEVHAGRVSLQANAALVAAPDRTCVVR